MKKYYFLQITIAIQVEWEKFQLLEEEMCLIRNSVLRSPLE
ncbi:hypothetical protein QG37_07940 [Candidozyma auris]|uniref:Uncharacterized protein n=1 Tax=Candidozyma auris TaxID=498019 RepID=A0A0L0NNA2_CANAR|nr:hypothetical protein QG37_07940 [[Candida] auris]